MATASSALSAPRILDGLSAVSGAYDAALVDVWGVLHNGRERFAPAEEACRRFRETCGPVVLISNSPRVGSEVRRQLKILGFGDDFYDDVVTSGDVTRVALAAQAPGPAFKLGPDRDDHIYDGLGLSFSTADDARFIACTGLFDDTTETPEDYAEMLARFASRRLEMVCANPDIVVNRGGVIIYCAGALARDYAKLGGRVTMAGKPHAPIYDAALDAVARIAGAPAAGASVAVTSVDRARVLAIGDGPHTDLAGAAAQGIDALFIAGGVHAHDLGEGDEDFTPEAALSLLAEDGHPARYAARDLRW